MWLEKLFFKWYLFLISYFEYALGSSKELQSLYANRCNAKLVILKYFVYVLKLFFLIPVEGEFELSDIIKVTSGRSNVQIMAFGGAILDM